MAIILGYPADAFPMQIHDENDAALWKNLVIGARGATRTPDRLIKSQALFRLSYASMWSLQSELN